MYDTAEYASSRLQDTIVKYGGRAVSVCRVEEDLTCVIRRLGTIETHVVPLSELDLTPIRLGYVNFERGSYYLQRVPKRNDWRQGLRNNNVNHGILLEPCLSELLEGIYPSLGECVDATESGHDEKAFSRFFSVSQGGCLNYKGRRHVGEVRGGKPVLLGDFKFLEEVLKESLDAH